MEITPSNTKHTDSLLSRADASVAKLTSIEALGLSPTQSYRATVIGRHQDVASKGADAATQNIGTDTPRSASSESAQQWLISIKGKTLLISTAENLVKGQTLEVKLAPANTVTGELSLVVKSLPTRESFINPPVSLLLKAMSQSLPRQMSLNAGLAMINQYALQTPESSTLSNAVGLPDSTKLATVVMQVMRPLWLDQTRLINALNQPLSTDINTTKTAVADSGQTDLNSPKIGATNVTGTQNGAEQIRTALQNSGMLLENKLFAAPAQKALVALQQSLIKALSVLSSANTSQPQGQTASPTQQNLSAKLSESFVGKPEVQAKANAATTVSSPLPPSSLLKNTAPQQSLFSKTEQALLNSYQQLITATSSQQDLTTSPSLINSLKSLHNGVNLDAFNNSPAIQDALKTVKTQTLELMGQIATSGPSAPPNLDLKSTLTGLLATLNTQAPNSGPSNTFIDGATQANLLTSAFAFPHPAANLVMMNATSKADAMLAGQELSTGQILKLLAGMLNRLQFNQLNSMYQTQNNSTDNAQTQSWFFELPMNTPTQQPDFFSLRLDRDRKEDEQRKKQEDTKEQWRINLSFTLEALGKITIQANLTPPTISASIWSHSEAVLNLVQKEQAALCQRLENLGLDLTKVQCLKGQPVDTNASINKQFVDTRA